METYSQSKQDVFVLNLLPVGPRGNTFVDLAAGDPIIGNNTFLLESKGWRGILIDNDPKFRELYKNTRKSDFLIIDATKLYWDYIIVTLGNVIDYLSFDLDDIGESVFKKIPFDKIEFKIITVEHDKYRLGEKPQKIMRDILEKHGYKLVRPNVAHNGNEYEDWFVNPKYISAEKIIDL